MLGRTYNIFSIPHQKNYNAFPHFELRNASSIAEVGTHVQHTTLGVQSGLLGPDLAGRLEPDHPTLTSQPPAHLVMVIQLWNGSFSFSPQTVLCIRKKPFPNKTSICVRYLMYIISFSLSNPTLTSASEKYQPKRFLSPSSLFTQNCKNLLFCLWVHLHALADPQLRSQSRTFNSSWRTHRSHLQSRNLQTCSATGQTTRQEDWTKPTNVGKVGLLGNLGAAWKKPTQCEKPGGALKGNSFEQKFKLCSTLWVQKSCPNNIWKNFSLDIMWPLKDLIVRYTLSNF